MRASPPPRRRVFPASLPVGARKMEAILSGLLSPTNDVRQQAEQAYNQAVAAGPQQASYGRQMGAGTSRRNPL